MEPATVASVSTPLFRLTPPRRPLQPHNCIPAASPPFNKKRALSTPAKGSTAAAAGKENTPALTGAEEVMIITTDVSLGEELGAARRRRDRLKQDRERTEEVLRAIDRALQRGFREMERRAEEQRLVDLAIRWMVGMRSFSESPLAESEMPCSPTFQSLREKERERRTVIEISKVPTTRDVVESAEGRGDDEFTAGDKHLDTRTEQEGDKGDALEEISDKEIHTKADKQEVQSRISVAKN